MCNSVSRKKTQTPYIAKGIFSPTPLPLNLFSTKTKKAMDTLYLLRFHKQTPLADLEAEQQDLYLNIKQYQRLITDLDPLESYSTVASHMRRLASAKAKKSYIDRLISLAEIKLNRANKELTPQVYVSQSGFGSSLFPDDYYGDYPQ